MNLGGQSQNFPFYFFHSSAQPAGAVPAASEWGRGVWGGRSPPQIALSTHWKPVPGRRAAAPRSEKKKTGNSDFDRPNSRNSAPAAFL